MAKHERSLSLFPIMDQAPPDAAPSDKTGIARMAAEGQIVGEGHLIEFHGLRVRSMLNRTASRRGMAFDWSINPYRGCEFACRYCYARYTHDYLELRGPEEFERKIFIKQNAAWLLEQELKRVRAEEEIAIGTATDPYQPIERQAKVTRSLLELLSRQKGLRLGLVTKSTLIERDIPLLLKIAQDNTLVLHLTITTPSARLARLLEPRAPRPDLRLRTVSRLRQAGLTAGILCSPVLPGITDTAKAIDAMAAKARAADASFFSAQPLFLKPCSKATYLGLIQEHFPELEEMYKQRFAKDAFVSVAYRKRIAALVEAARNRHGLARRPGGGELTAPVTAPIKPVHGRQGEVDFELTGS
ncbi:MAG TPA: radical SAM protein [Acidobacteriaceae bacterium]|nr:radical SAM protein [Acidobacteriaceae bacterium]